MSPKSCIADLAPLALELAAWGVSDPATPCASSIRHRAAAFAQARDVLHRTRCARRQGRASPRWARLMAKLPLHPRLAHMIARGKDLEAGALAADLAAILVRARSPRARCRRRYRRPARSAAPRHDQQTRCASGSKRRRSRSARLAGIERGGAQAMSAPACSSRSPGPTASRKRAADAAGSASSGGGGAVLPEHDPLARRRVSRRGDDRWRLGRPAHLPRRSPGSHRYRAPFRRPYRDDATSSAWDGRAQLVVANRQRRLGALILDEPRARRRPIPS